MKKFTLLMVVAVFAMTLIGCETVKENNNTNKALVVNNNSNLKVDNTNTVADVVKDDDWNWDNDITRENYDKDKGKYETAAKTRYKEDTIGQGVNDSWLWTKTRAALATTSGLRESTINVDVNSDVVTLKGTVGTKEQEADAVRVAKGIDGVKDVKTMLKVEPMDSVVNSAIPEGKNSNK